MRALTIYASWAHAIVRHTKSVENREWEPPRAMLGQRIAIHAGKTLDAAGLDAIERIDGVRVDPKDVPRSAIVGVATLAGWFRNDRQYRMAAGGLPRPRDLGSPWFVGSVGLVLEERVWLPEPVHCRGMLGFWAVPDDVEAAVRVQIARAA